MNITYTQNGDYLIPNIIIRKTKPLGHYGKFLHCFRCAVSRESVHFERYMQVIEQLRGLLHNGEVGSAAHDDANDWRHESLNY